MKILLIEDDLDDIELLEEALQTEKVPYKIDIIKEGDAAVKHIRTSEPDHDIIILDFNLPKVHGKEVLIQIKSVASYKNIPLLILTTSSAREDVEYSYQNGADKFLIKPTTLEQFKETVNAIVHLAGVIR
jgi:DNA-binding response OmpR family regulator